MTHAISQRRRGGPLVMLILLLSVWGTGRAVLWENPFPLPALDEAMADLLLAEAEQSGRSDNNGQSIKGSGRPSTPTMALVASAKRAGHALGSASDPGLALSQAQGLTPPVIAAGHQFLMAAAFKMDWGGSPASKDAAQSPVSPIAPPMLAESRKLDRWSLDAFGFYRSGSSSGVISQGRVPVYGASQIGAILQYRIAPQSPTDPRLFVRAYRDFVGDGENEVAAGVSARPVGKIPVRLAAELRATNNAFGTELRPAAYAITEMPRVTLPLSTRLEVYAGAGFVGGDAETLFADGQANITRQIAEFQGVGARRVRFSLGGGTWGGAQKGANRLDVGPTMRLDTAIGDVPARLSLDWRERVAGDAAPTSGLAATLSTRF